MSAPRETSPVHSSRGRDFHAGTEQHIRLWDGRSDREAIGTRKEGATDGMAEQQSQGTAIASTPRAAFNFSKFRHYMKENDISILEKAVKAGLGIIAACEGPVKVMAGLKETSTADRDDPSRWAESIREVHHLARPTRTIIGVVGATGAGKSSLTNALLDVESLLPTSCARACTGCVTEVSYNYEDMAFRAEVEFISPEDWYGEVTKLLQDVADSRSSGSSEYMNPDTYAGAAYAKLAAVYPHHSARDFGEVSKETLFGDHAVQALLGTTIKLKEPTSDELSDKLRTYVESGREGREDGSSIDYWPLLKVVRVFMRAPVLATGAVIVDLPGLQDSNAARAAVATSYIKACTSLWVVAPIPRAVDDKSAKDMLGESFRRQMMFDVSYSAVSFVCSKTDEIVVQEAVKNLGLSRVVGEDMAAIDSAKLQAASHKTAAERLVMEKYRLMDVLATKQEELDEKEGVVQNDHPGDSPTGSKRRRGDVGGGRQADGATAALAPEADVAVKGKEVERLRREVKETRRAVYQLYQDIDKRQADQQKAEAAQEAAFNGVKGLCIRQRNSVSAARIRLDFAEGIREIEEANAIERDEDGFDPDEGLKEYDNIAQNMSVFCVSSRAYQCLRGQLAGEGFNTAGYRGPDDTGIPALQAHGRRMTEMTRAARARQLLGKMSGLLYNVSFWITGHDMVQAGLDTVSVNRYLEVELTQLAGVIEEESMKCHDAIKQAVQESIRDRADSLMKRMSGKGVATVRRWFSKVRDGGYACATIRVLCKTHGIRPAKGASAAIDLQEELARPLKAGVSGGWKSVFSRAIPLAVEEFSLNCRGRLKEFEARIEAKYDDNANLAGALHLFSESIATKCQSASYFSMELKRVIDSAQRDANRAFIDPIAASMAPVYEECADIRGTGCTAKMRGAMVVHLETEGYEMYQASKMAVYRQLDDMESKVKKMLSNYSQGMRTKIERDLASIFVAAIEGKRVRDGEVAPKARLTEILGGVDAAMSSLKE